MNNTVSSAIQQLCDIIEENNIEEIPSFFITRLYNGGSGDSSIVSDFLWWCQMMDLYKIQFKLKKYKGCQETLEEMKSKFGAYSYFQKMEDALVSIQRKLSHFLYNGRDDVTWEEMPLEVRKHDYPYYFDKDGNDCFPFLQK